MGDAPRPGTRERLLEAAGAVFAARGYRGATLREIARRAGTNLAAANYHFGSKQRLYREVARSHFQRLQRRLAESGALAEPEALAALSPAQLGDLLRARVRTMLETLLDRENPHATLMKRELADPTEALPFMVRRYVEPLHRDLERLLAALAPALAPAELERCALSAIGQVSFYLLARPALLLLMRRKDYPRGFADEVADHVTRFTLGALEHLAAQAAAPGNRRARSGRGRS
jgi:AcrR family transcriptional regulator